MSSFGRRRLEATGVRHEEKYSFRVRRGDRSSAVETTRTARSRPGWLGDS
jgi:hypothetical protein